MQEVELCGHLWLFISQTWLLFYLIFILFAVTSSLFHVVFKKEEDVTILCNSGLVTQRSRQQAPRVVVFSTSLSSGITEPSQSCFLCLFKPQRSLQLVQQCCAQACTLGRFSTRSMSQHILTGWANECNMLCPTMLRSVAFKCCNHLAWACKCWANIVGMCCIEMLLSFGWGFRPGLISGFCSKHKGCAYPLYQD